MKSITDEDADDGMDDVSDDEDESTDVANRRRMSIRCASIARHILLMLRSHSLGLLISPRKAQLLYYDRSAIITPFLSMHTIIMIMVSLVTKRRL